MTSQSPCRYSGIVVCRWSEEPGGGLGFGPSSTGYFGQFMGPFAYSNFVPSFQSDQRFVDLQIALRERIAFLRPAAVIGWPVGCHMVAFGDDLQYGKGNPVPLVANRRQPRAPNVWRGRGHRLIADGVGQIP